MQTLDGASFVADRFVLEYQRGPDMFANGNKPAKITNFEDGLDRIMLKMSGPGQYDDKTYWWKETTEAKADYRIGDQVGNMTVITLYNEARPAGEHHVIARIMDFDGTFSHDDFIHADGTAVNSGQIIEIL